MGGWIKVVYSLPPQDGFLPYYFHISHFLETSLLEDNAIQIASDIGLIPLFLIIFPALPYLCIYAFEISEIQG